MKLEAIAVGRHMEGWAHPEPASPKRDWMDRIPHGFPYRCVPLSIANAAGWVIRCPTTITGYWGGPNRSGSIDFWFTEGDAQRWGVSNVFGYGLVTFALPWLFRLTPAEPYSLWVRGYPNYHKTRIQPVEGIVEVGWCPFTFTMSWQAQKKQRFQFMKGEPICFITLTELAALETLETSIVTRSEADPALVKAHDDYLASRTAFNARKNRDPKEWQRYYHRGTDAGGCPVASLHRTTSLRLQRFSDEDPPPYEAASGSSLLEDLQRDPPHPMHEWPSGPEEEADPDRPRPDGGDPARHAHPRGDPRRVPVSRGGRSGLPGRTPR